MSLINRRQFLALAGLAALATATGCTNNGPRDPDAPRDPRQPPATGKPYPAKQIGISLPGAPKDLAIGLIASLTAPAGQGTDWLPGVGGARVAGQRLLAAGTSVKILTASDAGNEAGIKQTLEGLAKQGAAGVVVASSGSHLDGLPDLAKKAGLPVLLPHADSPLLQHDGVYVTGPLRSSCESALAGAVKNRSLSRPLLLLAPGASKPGGIEPVAVVTPPADVKAIQITELVAPHISGAVKPDCLVIAGGTAQLAQVLAAVQGARLGLPTFLTWQALAPSFADHLAKAGGSRAGDITTCGADAGDDVAMRTDARGAAMAGFLLANRLAAADTAVKDFFNNSTYAGIAPAANPLVHDAVLALVAAAATAKSGKPEEVRDALRSLTLSHDQGLAAGGLDFTRPEVYDVKNVVPLAASAEDLGLRPRGNQPQMAWFRAPGA